MTTKQRRAGMIAIAVSAAVAIASSPSAFANTVGRSGSFAIDIITPGSDSNTVPVGSHLDVPIQAAGLAGVPMSGASDDGPPATGVGNGYAHGAQAVSRLGDRLPDVAMRNGMTASALEHMLLEDPSVGVNSHGHIVFVDSFDDHADHADHAEETSHTTAEEAPLTGSEFELASNPGAAKTIFLDFDGHVTEGTWWNYDNGGATIVSPAFNTDGDPNNWSSEELRVVRESWLSVSETFAPWDINVTTKDPGYDALYNSGGDDTEWGIRIVITRNNFYSCSCSGVAYGRSFGKTGSYGPGFVFSTNNGRIYNVISHEIGHTLGLSHDGSSSATYYRGHAAGNGAASWGPIMGAAGGRTVLQWSQQEYTGANNNDSNENYGTGLDDITVISSMDNQNQFGLRADDHGNDATNATQIPASGSTLNGIISTRTDVDVFKFTMTAGVVDIQALPAAFRPNLDIKLTVRDESGAVVATASPAYDLDARLTLELPAGTYTAEVDGVGAGDPTTSPPTGYSDYASLGQFTLTATLPLIAPDLTAPAAPSGVTAAEADGAVVVSWNANSESDLAAYTVYRSSASGGPYTALGTVEGTSYTDNSPLVGENVYVVTAFDNSSNESANSAEAVVSIAPPPPPPPPPASPKVASGQSVVSGAVSGSFEATHARDGNVQTLSETESGGKPANRHDRGELRWTIPVDTGVQTLQVVASATDAGDRDQGFMIEWSADGSTWSPIVTVQQGTPVDGSFELGWAAGNIQVRAIDTDRSRGERSFDSVQIDFLQTLSDGNDARPVASNALASVSFGTAGAGRGAHYGVATVNVLDESGLPVAGASVSVQFTGDFNEVVSGTTGSNGAVQLTTAASVKKPTVDGCIASVDADGLTYLAGHQSC